MRDPLSRLSAYAQIATTAVLIALIAQAACIHNQNATANLTAQQKVIVYNGTLAAVNKSVEAGAAQLFDQKILTEAQTRQVLDYCEAVANASETVRKVTAAPGDWATIGAQVKATLASVAVDQWLAKTGINNPQIKLLLTSVSTTMGLILQEVQ